VVYREGDCPVAEAMAHVHFQVNGNYYEDLPERVEQLATALRKVGENAVALREHFDREKGAKP
jgi:hypothetical protein